jgi:hypothetical protein
MMAHRLVGAVKSVVEVLTEKRDPLLVPGDWCSYCPLRSTCPAVAVPAGLVNSAGKVAPEHNEAEG